MSAEPLNRYRSDREANHLRVHLGHLVSNQEMEVVVKLGFAKGTEAHERCAEFTVRDPADAVTAVPAELRWTYADHEANDAQPRDREVGVAVATLYAGRAREEALERNRDGARRVLRATARRIRSYAGSDRRLLAIAEQLETEAEEYGARMLSALEMSRPWLRAAGHASGKARRSGR